MAKEKSRNLVPDLLRKIENADDIETVIINENKLACMFASPLLLLLAVVSFLLRYVVLHEESGTVMLDVVVCIVLGLSFELVLRFKIKSSSMVNAVSALYGVWFLFIFLRFFDLLGPLIWIIAFIHIILAMSQVRKNMLMICGTIIIAAAVYSYIKIPDINISLNRLYYGLLVTLIAAVLLIAGAVHRTSISRYKKMISNYKTAIDQRQEIENLYEEVKASEEELFHQNEILTEYNNRIQKDEEELHHLAYHDSLTDLPNRKMLYQVLGEMIDRAAILGSKVYVVYIDIDYFKNINDTLGHDAGDEFIAAVAGRIKTVINPEDILGRMGGDEFALVIPRDIDEDDIYLYLNILKDKFSEKISIQGIEIKSTVSMGVSVYPEDGADAIMMMKNADIAMYKSKELGKNIIQFFYPELREEMIRRIENRSRL